MRIGDFEIIGPLGSGATGVVYQATNLTTKRVVALKELDADSPEAKARAIQEGRAMASVNSLHLVTIYNIHEIGDRMYLEYELVEGASLPDLVATEGLSADAAERLLRDLLQGLQAMHGIGLVHGDLKPENVMIRSDGSAVITDLGLASRGSATFLGGASQFMAPEMFKPPFRREARTDLYSLGMTVYEAVVGRGNMAELFPDILSGRGAALDHLWQSWAADRSTVAVPVDRIRPDIPETLSQLIADLMAKDPASRPASAAEALGRLAPSKGQRTATLPPRDAPATNRVTRIAETPIQKAPGRSPWLAIGLIVGALILATGAFLLYLIWPRDVRIETIPSGATLKAGEKSLGIITPTTVRVKGRGNQLTASRLGYKDATVAIANSGATEPVRMEPWCAGPEVPQSETKILVGDGFPMDRLEGLAGVYQFVGAGCEHDLELSGDGTKVSFALPGLATMPMEEWPIANATPEEVQKRLKSLAIAWELGLGWPAAEGKIVLMRKIPSTPPRIENYECCETKPPAIEVNNDVVAFSLPDAPIPSPTAQGDEPFMAFLEISPDGEVTLHANAASNQVRRVPAGPASWLTVQPPRTPMQFFVALGFPGKPAFLAPFEPTAAEPFRLLKADEVEALRTASREQGGAWTRRYSVFEVK